MNVTGVTTTNDTVAGGKTKDASRDVAEDLLAHLASEPVLTKAAGILQEADGICTLCGLAGSTKSAVVAHLARATGRGVLLVTAQADEALRMAADLAFWLGNERVDLVPPPESLPYSPQPPAEETTGERLRSLHALQSEAGSVVVASHAAALWKLPPPEALLGLTHTIRVGDILDPPELAAILVRRGYERVAAVDELGQFSVRGGIVDVFPHFSENPVRIEFSEIEVESIRHFRTSTQRSMAQIDSVSIPPRREVLPPPGSAETAVERLRELGAEETKDFARLAEAAARGTYFEGIEWFRPLFWPEGHLLVDYADEGRLIVLDEPHRLAEEAGELHRKLEAAGEERRHAGRFAFPPGTHYARQDEWTAALAGRPRLDLHLLPKPPAKGAFNLDSRSSEPFGSNLNLVRQWLHARRGSGRHIYILCPTQVQASRLIDALGEEADGVRIGVGSLSSGFALADSSIELLTDRELYGRVTRRAKLPKFRGSGPVRDVLSLNRGDYVVHVNHGIGRYLGTERVRMAETESECLVVGYAQGDRVFVPIEQLGLLEKYSAPDGPSPKLSRLGTVAWERTKSRAKKAIQEMAAGLVKLYAERRGRPGHAFPSDTPWQRELEATFPYEETPDQLRTIEEIKTDMESARPMDRLVCGDVGYGKTEVALRAAFKAVMDGCQVAVLVPTTILAQQHLNTFRERLAPFPVKVEMLSRFRTPAEQKEILAQLTGGSVDMVIGTHRLLSKDVKFHKLGLVIIDEEHRFGVGHKERLKKMRATVDVLTMTATPIPRTLHMALMGARDLSTIETPPRDRVAIQTEIVPFDPEFISHAILKEIERGGQIFFVHNRVQSIHSMARFIQGLLPQLRVGVAHGQMSERELERAMLSFTEQRHDILVSTMIIESGLDMPRVNTLLVNRADRFGLAQLYQLRGRVGRSNEQAYAYLLLPARHAITEDAEKRLAIIAETSELGAGMRLALRDLEIRGAGNVLGAEQHGFMMEIGMELYCRLLDEAVRELKGEEVEPRRETRIDTDVSALLPEDYVEDGGERVAIYRRLIRMRKAEELAGLAEELQDRFGALPEEAGNLLELQRIKLLAEKAGVDEIRVRGTDARLRFDAGREPGRDRLQRFVAGLSYPLEFATGGGLSVLVTLPKGSLDRRLAALQECIVNLGTA